MQYKKKDWIAIYSVNLTNDDKQMKNTDLEVE